MFNTTEAIQRIFPSGPPEGSVPWRDKFRHNTDLAHLNLKEGRQGLRNIFIHSSPSPQM